MLRRESACLGLLITAGALLWAGLGAHAQQPAATTVGAAVRFTHLDVFIDSGAQPLAAYQFELKATAGRVAIVGVEGGEHAAFASPPYYDPAAMQHDRVILAAFNTGNDLPKGKIRVARIHVQITGDAAAEYETKLTVSASSNGEQIPATITISEGATR
jgi:hypothetical protein